MFKRKFIKVRRHVHLLAAAQVSLFYDIFLFPVRLFIAHLGSHGKQLLADDLQFVIKSIFLLAAGGRVIGDNYRAFFAPIFAFGPVSQKLILFLTFFNETTVIGNVHRLKMLQRRRGQILGEIGRVGGNEMHARMLVNPTVVAIGVHSLVDDHREPFFGFV